MYEGMKDRDCRVCFPDRWADLFRSRQGLLVSHQKCTGYREGADRKAGCSEYQFNN